MIQIFWFSKPHVQTMEVLDYFSFLIKNKIKLQMETSTERIKK